MPVHVVEKLNKIVGAEGKLRGELGREPSSVEIAVELKFSVEEVEQIRRSAQTPVSLEQPVGMEGEAEFGDFLEDESAPSAFEILHQSQRSEALTRALDTLAPRERQVVELRYGLNGREPQTLDAIGRTLAVSRERIRQIEGHALRRLRMLTETAWLSDLSVGA